MAVLNLFGKPIDWLNPPAPNARVKWSRKDQYGRDVTGSLRTIALLDETDDKAVRRFGTRVVVIQPPYNEGVPQSAGTHDKDACIDAYIPGVDWRVQERFFRTCGWGAYWRRPPAFGNHIHMFMLPEREGANVSDDYRSGGFTVGKYVDGGYSLYGRKVASSQIEDYYEHKTALSGHAYDPSWFPGDTKGTSIAATIFDLDAYIERQAAAMPNPRIATSWNLLTGRPLRTVARELRAVIKENGKPPVVSLQEATKYRTVIKTVAAAMGYRVYQPRDIAPKAKGVQARESGSTALLVRKDIRLRKSFTIRCKETWKGPKHGLVHEGRVLPGVVGYINGRWTTVIANHMPTGKNLASNRKAWDEQQARIKAVVKNLGYPFTVIGDNNEDWKATDRRSMRVMAKSMGGRIVHTTARYDYTLTNIPSGMTKGPKRGSDHPTITQRKK